MPWNIRFYFFSCWPTATVNLCHSLFSHDLVLQPLCNKIIGLSGLCLKFHYMRKGTVILATITQNASKDYASFTVDFSQLLLSLNHLYHRKLDVPQLMSCCSSEMNLNCSPKGKAWGDRETGLGGFLQYWRMEKERAAPLMLWGDMAQQ